MITCKLDDPSDWGRALEELEESDVVSLPYAREEAVPDTMRASADAPIAEGIVRALWKKLQQRRAGSNDEEPDNDQR